MEMNADQILQGINESPLDDKVKQEIVKKLGDNADLVAKYIRRFPCAGIVAETMNFQNDVTRYIMNIIAPVLAKHNAAPENGRDTARHIYKNLGGKNRVSFEVDKNL